MRQAMAEMVMADASAHLYGPVLGLPPLRNEIARTTARIYGGAITPDQVAVTAGCNQAFCAVVATLAGPGDEVILPTPWYFNHKMELDMGAQVEYPPETIAAFRDLARARGIALIIDETYRDFHSSADAPHGLFADPDWDDTVVHLYSFSKAYRLTGHRVGAILAAPDRLAQVEKYLDTTTICPPQLGQRAALWGMENLGQWLAGERDEILARRRAMEEGFQGLDDWELLGSGAYFAYARHPFEESSHDLAQRLVRDAGLLMLPGTMFRPASDPSGAREMRIAFANLDTSGIREMFTRLAGLRP
jgi:aspartate/methionine/tyrosine aminotransferase